MRKNSDRFVVAVSGGVDSVVLLDALVNNHLSELTTNHQLPITNHQIIVAHFDHGMREDSVGDCEFVTSLAKRYGLSFESERIELGPEASEAAAREVRYNFLRRCCKKYQASLILAHHQDDLIETMLINLIRGTGWRGLVSMGQISELRSQSLDDKILVLRPLLSVAKSDILAYAKKYKLEWREDSTNQNQKYVRNKIRHEIIPKMLAKDPESKKKLLAIHQHILSLKKEIATELQNLIITSSVPLPTAHSSLPTSCTIPRYQLISWPDIVSTEVIHSVLTSLDSLWNPNKEQIERVLWFVKTAQAGKKMEVSGGLQVSVSSSDAAFQFLP